MSTLLERIAASPTQQDESSDSACIASGERVLSRGELLSAARNLRHEHPGLRGSGVVVEEGSLADICVALAAFDGWCSDLWLCPPQLPRELFEPYLHQTGSCFSWRHGKLSDLPGDHRAAQTGQPGEHTRWWLTTSGTSGSPKLIGHTLAGLSNKSRISRFSRSLHWGLVYQPYRFAGLQVVLQALLSGALLVDASQPDADERIDAMLAHGVDALSATPSLWRALLMTGRLQSLPLKQLTLGGEIADQALLHGLRQLFPDAKIQHIYASTEVGVGFTVTDGRAGFPGAWLDSGSESPLAMRIDARDHLLIKPEGGAARGIADGLIDADGYLDTQDQVRREGDRVLFLGRAGGVINVGGNKVHPETVEQVILAVPGILQARVYGKSSSMLGQLVAADVVAADSANRSVLQMAVMKHCLAQLARHEVPAKLNWVDSIQAGDTGKMKRN